MYTLESERLHLRSFQLADWDALNSFLADPEVTRYMHFHAWTEEKRRKWLAWCVQNSAEPTPDAYNWAITLKSTGQLIGWLGIGSPSQPTVPGERDFVMSSIAILGEKATCPKRWARSYALSLKRSTHHVFMANVN